MPDIPARKPRRDALRAQGVGRHLTPADLLVFGPRGPIDNRLRFADEPARHKVLDLIGDLALCGFDLAGHVVAYRSGPRAERGTGRGPLATRGRVDESASRSVVRSAGSPRGLTIDSTRDWTTCDLTKAGDGMTRLRMAVIGVGHLGQHHARILAGLPDVELVGVVDANPEQARADRRAARHHRLRPLRAAARPGRRRQRRHARRSTTTRSPPRSSRPACRCWSRSRSAARVAEADDLIALADDGRRAAPGRAHRAVQPGVRGTGRGGRSARSSSRPSGTGRSPAARVDIGAVLDLMIHDLDLLLALVGGAGAERVGGRGGGVRRARGHGERPAGVRERVRRPRHRQPDHAGGRSGGSASGPRRATRASTSSAAS